MKYNNNILLAISIILNICNNCISSMEKINTGNNNILHNRNDINNYFDIISNNKNLSFIEKKVP